VVQVGVRRIAYPTVVADAVYNRMRSEREKEAMKYRAEGREEAAKIEAGADREVSGILAEAYKEAQLLRGKGDAEAARIYADAFGKDAEFYRFVRSLNLYEMGFQEGSVWVFSGDEDLLQYLSDSKGASQQ